MTHKQFRALLDLVMCSDPWPLGKENQEVIESLLNEEAQKREWPDWIMAYHEQR